MKRPMKPTYVSTRAYGFSLIEVMVAVIVICVGLLGITKMEALSLSNATTSRQRSLAAIEAASLASAMHSNRDYWSTAAPATVTWLNSAITSSDAVLQADATADVVTAGACVGTVADGAKCTPVQLAAYDFANWSASLALLLPNPWATILCPNYAGLGLPTSCTIQIGWSEKAVGINQQEATAAAGALFETPTYTLYVEP
jgi:type IV pilus assembly protein PilV